MGERPGLYVDGLSVSFKNKVLFEDIHFVLTPGDKVTLVGENGIGKSTFLKILKGDPFEGEGRIQRSGTLGYLPQSFETFPNQRALDHVILQSRDEALIQALQDKVFADSGWEVPFQTLGGHELFRTLAHLALTPDILMKSFGELSGGEKTKLHLCALQHFNPDLLLLDEPTNHLDRKGISWLGRFLRGFEGGLLIVTHDRSLIHESGVRISELSPVTHQLIHFHGGYRGYLEAQERLWERAKQERETQEKELKLLQDKWKSSQGQMRSHVRRPSGDRDKLGFNARGERKQRGQSRLVSQLEKKVDSLESRLREIPPERTKASFALAGGEGHENVRLEAKELGYVIAGKPLFQGLSFALEPGDRLVITGRNGCGKTTLLKILAGLLPPQAGEFTTSYGAEMGFLDQEQETLDLNQSAVHFLEDQNGPARRTEIMYTLEKVGVYHFQDMYAPLSQVSVGCRRKTQLADLILRRPQILLLDEPTNHIDFLSLEKIEEQLLLFPGISLSVSHDPYFIQKIATQVLCLEDYRGDYNAH